jgi:predicted DNA-binding transcriptional regulator AlpA
LVSPASDLDRFVPLKEVCRIAGGCHRSTVYRWSAQKIFPKIHKIGPRASGVLKSDLAEWLKERVTDK